MTDTINRFSNRVANYVQYRPDYPRGIIAHLSANFGLTGDSVIADVGSGTGISAKMFLENGNCVFGVEPNAAMRGAAEEFLAGFQNFTPIDGTSDETTLETGSVDMVVAAQAFHWFDPEKTRTEFHRILKPAGHIVLIWNERHVDTTPFLVEYEAFLVKYAYDYGSVRHENIQDKELGRFFQTDYCSAVFPNEQTFDFAGIRGRMLSASYMPNESDATFPMMENDLRRLFEKHAENDRIRVFYDTRVYCSRI